MDLMQTLAIGLWGCFFGGCLLVLSGAAYALSRSMYRIGINASLSAIGPAFVVIAFFGGLPIGNGDGWLRFLAHLTLVVGAVLVYQLLNILGSLKKPSSRKSVKVFFVMVCVVASGASWLLTPADALRLCSMVAFLMALYACGVSIRNVLRGDYLAWVAVTAVALVITSYFGLSFGVLNPGLWAWEIKALSAATATGYMLTLGFINWQRYAYLLELKKVMAYGPAYDPVTRLRSHAETGQMVRDNFDNRARAGQPLGVIVVTIANLYALEKLHGTAAANSALFLTAVRLKRLLPARVDVGRLGFDSFLLIVQNSFDAGRLVLLAHELNERLHKSVTLTTNPDDQKLESASTVWTAQAGIGVLHVKDPSTSSLDAITTGRRMARTAVSYASHIAWFDHSSGETVELPVMKRG
jgi:GGDEF domain-containing protein